MNYKYEVGASFPRKLLRKGETQSQVQSEKKPGLQNCQRSVPLRQNKKYKTAWFRPLRKALNVCTVWYLFTLC